MEEVKVENIDIFEKFIDENDIGDRRKLEISTEFGSGGPSNEFYGVEYFSTLKSENSHSQDERSFLICESIPEQTSVTNAIQEHGDLKLKPSTYVVNHRADLKQHIDAPDLKQFKCKYCDYVARRKNNLKLHTESIHLNLKHKCAICDYAASRKGYLKVHMDSVHFNLKLHECEQCDYSACRKSDLKLHIDSVHLNLKQHKCGQCEYAASRKHHLKRHIDSVHLNLKQNLRQLKCEQCEYTISRKSLLKRHIDVVHLNLKQHKCEQCEYATNRRNLLKQHINCVHLK